MRVVQNSNNIIRVLKEIKIKPGISRIEISKNIGLDKSTVTLVASRLMDLGFIEESSESLTPYQGGRRPVGLRLREKIGIVLGIEIQTEYYVAVMIDLDGTIYKTMRGELSDKNSLFQSFVSVYNTAKVEIDNIGLKLLGVGIGTAGIINPHQGVITDSNPLVIHEPENFYDEVASFLDVPVFIDNDANCGCWAELSDLSSGRPQDFLFVLGEYRRRQLRDDVAQGIAVGMGIVIQERVHYGTQFSAGEYRSPSWMPPNKSQFSLSDEEQSTLQSEKALVDRVKGELCRDIAFLVNMLNLTRVTMSGSLADHIETLAPLLQKEIDRNWPYDSPRSIEIKAAHHQEKTIAFGAAAMLLEQLFHVFETPSENPWKQKVGTDLFNSFADTIKTS